MSKSNMKKHETSNKKKKVHKKEEEKDERVKPQRPLNNYIYYSNDMVPKIKAEQGIPHKEAMVKAAEIWKEMSEKEKKPYNDMHYQDVERFEGQMNELKENGFFLMADGTKSTDIEASSKKRKSTIASKERTSKKKKGGEVNGQMTLEETMGLGKKVKRDGGKVVKRNGDDDYGELDIEGADDEEEDNSRLQVVEDSI